MTDALSMLVAERDRLNRAIEILQGETKRRGRKPGSVAAAPTKTRRRKMSAAAKKAISDRMKKYWAGRRKATKK
jgi:hypothetical protein